MALYDFASSYTGVANDIDGNVGAQIDRLYPSITALDHIMYAASMLTFIFAQGCSESRWPLCNTRMAQNYASDAQLIWNNPNVRPPNSLCTFACCSAALPLFSVLLAGHVCCNGTLLWQIAQGCATHHGAEVCKQCDRRAAHPERPWRALLVRLPRWSLLQCSNVPGGPPRLPGVHCSRCSSSCCPSAVVSVSMTRCSHAAVARAWYACTRYARCTAPWRSGTLCASAWRRCSTR